VDTYRALLRVRVALFGVLLYIAHIFTPGAFSTKRPHTPWIERVPCTSLLMVINIFVGLFAYLYIYTYIGCILIYVYIYIYIYIYIHIYVYTYIYMLYIYTYIGCILIEEAPKPLDRKSTICIIIDGYYYTCRALLWCIGLFWGLDIYIDVYPW